MSNKSPNHIYIYIYIYIYIKAEFFLKENLYSDTWHEPAIVKTEPVFNVHVF